MGNRRQRLPAARPRHRASLERRAEHAGLRSTWCWPRDGSDVPIAATARSSARPTARAAASTDRSAISFRDGATSRIRNIASTSPGVWDIEEPELPGPGVDAYEMFRKIDTGEIKGLISICFNPKVSLPDNSFVTRCLDKLEFYVAIDFFLNDTARHADIVLPGSLHEEDEGSSRRSRAASSRSTRRWTAPVRRGRTGASSRIWRAHSIGRAASTFAGPREIFEELRIASKGGVADYSGVTYEKVEREMGVFWPCYADDPKTGEPIADHPGTPRLFEPGSYNPIAKGAGPFYFPDGRARFNVADYRAARG